MALKSASTATTKLDLGEGDWVEVRTELAKREYKSLAAYFPDRVVNEENKLTASEGVALQTGLFAALVTGWSADIPATIDNYEGLDSADAQRIDAALAEHFKTMVPSADEGKAVTTSRGSKLKG